jgi:hypothetical protein
MNRPASEHTKPKRNTTGTARLMNTQSLFDLIFESTEKKCFTTETRSSRRTKRILKLCSYVLILVHSPCSRCLRGENDLFAVESSSTCWIPNPHVTKNASRLSCRSTPLASVPVIGTRWLVAGDPSRAHQHVLVGLAIRLTLGPIIPCFDFRNKQRFRLRHECEYGTSANTARVRI